ncbi:IS3 family transposase [Streptomyces colonosanans]|uniref:IS3 family transposase n=1 Tax=Streptomyces colonosanans TaxID=1428652 RepID=UPI0009A0E269
MWRELDLSVSAYNARRRRPKSARHRRDEQLIEHIRRLHAESGETYGAWRIHRQLRREGVRVARCTVEPAAVRHGRTKLVDPRAR